MRRRQFISLLGGAALSPLTELPVHADLPGGCGFPVARDDDWPVVFVNEDKLIERAALCRMADRLAASSANVHAVLVARGGKLVFERYFKGSDEINGRRVESVTFDVKAGHFLLADLDAFRVGIDNDTAQFSVNSIRRWLSLMGREAYSNTDQIMITADGGGSNGSRVRCSRSNCRSWPTKPD